jgi:hypothetical protein
MEEGREGGREDLLAGGAGGGRFVLTGEEGSDERELTLEVILPPDVGEFLREGGTEGGRNLNSHRLLETDYFFLPPSLPPSLPPLSGRPSESGCSM